MRVAVWCVDFALCSATLMAVDRQPRRPQRYLKSFAVRLTLGGSSLGTAMPSHRGPCQPSAKLGTATSSEVDELPENATEVWDVPVLWIPE